MLALVLQSALGACAGAPLPVTPELGPELLAVDTGDSFAYLLREGERVALVDAGSDSAGVALLAALAGWGLGPEAVEGILLTHAHRDHSAAMALFPRATLYTSAEDHLLLLGDRRGEGLLPRLLAHLGPAPPLSSRLQTVLPRTLIEVAGRSFEPYPIPGHTRGSLVFLEQDILFSGDSLLAVDDGVDAAPAMTSGRRGDNLAALGRLCGVPFVVLADGHRGLTSDGGDRFRSRFCPGAIGPGKGPGGLLSPAGADIPRPEP